LLAADPIKVRRDRGKRRQSPVPRSRRQRNWPRTRINAKGGVDGRMIEIVTYDNHSSSGGFGFAPSSARSTKTKSTP